MKLWIAVLAILIALPVPAQTPAPTAAPSKDYGSRDCKAWKECKGRMTPADGPFYKNADRKMYADDIGQVLLHTSNMGNLVYFKWQDIFMIIGPHGFSFSRDKSFLQKKNALDFWEHIPQMQQAQWNAEVKIPTLAFTGTPGGTKRDFTIICLPKAKCNLSYQGKDYALTRAQLPADLRGIFTKELGITFAKTCKALRSKILSKAIARYEAACDAGAQSGLPTEAALIAACDTRYRVIKPLLK